MPYRSSISHSVSRAALLFFVLLLFHCPDAVADARISSLGVTGNAGVGTQEILGWLATGPGLEYQDGVIARDRALIRARYREHGFYDAGCDSVGATYSADSSLVDLTFYISEGHRTIVHSFDLTGNRTFTREELLNLFYLRPEDPFVEEDLESDLFLLLDHYEQAGYPLASCTVTDLTVRPGVEVDSVVIAIGIDEGSVVTIDEITVEGNTETNADVVVRETRIRLGERFDARKNEAIRQRLRRLNLFSSVLEPQLYLRGERAGLLITVREGSPNTFDGVVGYVPGSGTGQEGYVTGLVSVTMRNLFGTGRKFSFRWEREDRFSQELGVRYLEPWVFGFPVNLGAGFYQRQQDTAFVRRVIDPKAELMVSEEFSLALFYVSDNVIPRAGESANRVFRTSSQFIGGELIYDTRDHPYITTSGVRYRTDIQYGNRKTSEIPEAFRQSVLASAVVRRYEIDLDFFLPAFRRQVIALGIHGRELQGDQPDEGTMYRFGGTRTMRGYRENQFLGTRIAWTNTEYRFLLSPDSFLYGFIDTGYYFRPDDRIRSIPSAEDFKYGYGVGIQVDTALGHLGVSYALGEGDSFSTGKVHFGLINEF